MNPKPLLARCVVLFVAAGANAQTPTTAPGDSMAAVADIRPAAAATTRPADNAVTGSVVFTDTGNGLTSVVIDLGGLAPNSVHGVHVHAVGDVSAPDLSSAGPHFDPAGSHQHGGPTADAPRHAGDLGNVQADANGHAHLEESVPGLSVHTGQPNDVLGKSVVVHAKADDEKSNPTGNSGARIAGGVVKWQKIMLIL